MKKLTMMVMLFATIASLLAGCGGKSEAEQHRLTKPEQHRLDSIDSAALKVAVMRKMDCLPV